jgi:hypothetical protein
MGSARCQSTSGSCRYAAPFGLESGRSNARDLCHFRRWRRSDCACRGLFTVDAKGTQMIPMRVVSDERHHVLSKILDTCTADYLPAPRAVGRALMAPSSLQMVRFPDVPEAIAGDLIDFVQPRYETVRRADCPHFARPAPVIGIRREWERCARAAVKKAGGAVHRCRPAVAALLAYSPRASRRRAPSAG